MTGVEGFRLVLCGFLFLSRCDRIWEEREGTRRFLKQSRTRRMEEGGREAKHLKWERMARRSCKNRKKNKQIMRVWYILRTRHRRYRRPETPLSIWSGGEAVVASCFVVDGVPPALCRVVEFVGLLLFC